MGINYDYTQSPLSSFIITDDQQTVISIKADDNDLFLEPDARTCAYQILNIFVLKNNHDFFVFGTDQFSVKIGSFHFVADYSMGEYAIEWEGLVKPPAFLEFMKEWNKMVQLKAFW